MQSFVVGIDEAGRGPLAGPIAFGACKILEKPKAEFFTLFHDFPLGKDSKKMTEKERNFWFEKSTIAEKENVLRIKVLFATPSAIDTLGLSRISRDLVKRLLKDLDVEPASSKVFLDGGLHAPKKFVQETIIKGDEKVFAISLASIAAKVSRDQKMVLLGKRYRAYGFERHKGYPTQEHFEALDKLGISPIHRKRFLVKWALRSRE